MKISVYRGFLDTPQVIKKDLEDFYHLVFSYPQAMSYSSDFPEVFFSDSRSLFLVILKNDEEKILASGALLTKKFRSQHASSFYEIGIISSIATHPEERKKGLGRLIIDTLNKEALHRNLQGICLWSDQEAFYQNLGFRAIGRQYLGVFSKRQIQPQSSWTLSRSWNPDHIKTLWSETKSKLSLITPERDQSFWDMLEKRKSIYKYSIYNHQGKCLAYLGYEKGMDFQNTVLEWGGSEEVILWCLNQILQDFNLDKIQVLLPSLKNDLNLTQIQPTHLCMYKKIKSPNFFEEEAKGDLWFWGLDSC